MKREKFASLYLGKIFLLSLGFFLLLSQAQGQYREYHLFGLVVDTENNPLAGVDIFLQDMNTSRNYRVRTDKGGKYVLSGLPHGRYQVTVKKEGYETRTFEWDFSQPQERMQKVEMETIILASGEKLKTLASLKELKAAVEEVMQKIQRNELESALSQLRELVEKYPEDSNVHYLLGVTLGRMQRYEEAIPELTRVIEMAPEFAPAYQQLGYCYQNLKNMDKALDNYKKSAELDPANSTNLYNLGLILFEMDKVDEALSYFEKALAAKSDDLDTLEMIARCYVNKGDLPKAVEYLEKARALAQNEEKIKFLDSLISTLKAQIKK
ncbi:MAG: tetratricopeptide repeat protein [Candidatus Saccharicenans sp.]|uniref:tetratricopeptide repeat protein n=1 Tax=Candidatus Saccharicenans sp. TaxID=2819258 RepID=UPI004049101E